MTKKNLLLGGLLAILLILAFVYKGPFKEWQASLGKPDNFLAKLDVDSINKIELERKGENINIDKIDNKWKIEDTKNFFVTEQIIGTALDTLREAKDSEILLVSENNKKKDEFEVNKENGCKVILKNGEEILAEFIIGKNGSDFNSSYIAEINFDSTYLIKANLRSAFDHDNWYDKTIFSFEKDKVNKIRFQYPSREFTVEKQAKEEEDGEWSGVLPYKFSVDQDKIDKIVSIVSNLNATQIPKQSFEGTGLEKNLIILQLTGEDIDAVIMIGDNNGEDLYYAKKGDSDNIYLITKQQRDELEKRISDLR